MGEATPVQAPFLGREVELAELRAALEDALLGHGRLVLLAGDPGIGKSRLADEIAEEATRRSAMVAWGRCWEAGGAPAYWPWVQSIRSCLRDTDRETLRALMGTSATYIAQVVPEMREAVPDIGNPPALEADAARFRLFDATASFLKNASQIRPLVLILDDLHVADKPSLMLLQFLAGELGAARLLVLCAYRDVELGPDHPLAATQSELLRQPSTRRLHLTGLAHPTAARLIEMTTGTAASAELVAAVQGATGGNPLFVGEVARLLAAEGRLEQVKDAASPRLVIPQGIRDVIGRRLSRLSEKCKDALTLASIVGRVFGLETLQHLSDSSPDELLEVLEPALVTRVITDVPGAPGRFRFSHVLVRDTLYEALPATRRMVLHREIAETLEELHRHDLDPHLAELAHHFFEAVPAGTGEKAVEYARRAAARAIALLAYEEAVRLYETALEALNLAGSGDETRRCDLLLGLGDAQARAGNVPQAKRTFLKAAEIARKLRLAEPLGQAALGYGGRFVWEATRGDRHIVPLLEDALRALPEGDGVLRARVMARLAGGPLRDDPDRRRRADLSLDAVEMARRLGEPSTLAYALDGRYAAVWWPENIDERLRIATELADVAGQAGEEERGLQGRHYRCLARLELGDMAGVYADLDAQARLAEELGQPAQHWYVAAVRATLATFEGRLEEAEALISDASALGERSQGSMAGAYHTIQLYLLRRHQGRLSEAEEMVRRSTEQFPTYPVLRCILAHTSVERGRIARGREILERFAPEAFARLPRNDEWLFSLGLLAEVCGRVGNLAHAASLYELLLPYAGRNAVSTPDGCTGSISRNLGIVAGTVGRSADAVRHFEDAIEANERAGGAPWAAYARHDFGVMLLERGGPGDRERARGLLLEARRIAQEIGMAGLAGHASERLGEGGEEPAAGARATGTERPRAAGHPNVFRREGEYWSIAFGGDAFRLKDTKGVRYIAYLLARAGEEIHPLELVSATEGASPRPEPTAEHRALDAGLRPSRGGTGEEVLDARARAAYRGRLEELEDELEEAQSWGDPERAARAKEEMDFLARELSGSLGLGGRARRAGSPAERARQSVTKAVKAALERIEKQAPSLGHHLSATVHTGNLCSYRPDPRVPPHWRL